MTLGHWWEASKVRIARYTLAGLLIALLVASIAYDRWAERPYIVTGHEWDNGSITVEYTLPGGGIGQRTFDESAQADAYLNCYALHVRVGDPLPDCMRGFLGGSN